MAGYSKTPLSKKFGLHPQDRVVLRDAPLSWRRELRETSQPTPG